MNDAPRRLNWLMLIGFAFLPASASSEWWSCEDDFQPPHFYAVSAQSDAVVVCYNSHAALWDLRQGRHVPLLDLAPAKGSYPAWRHAAFSDDGRYLALLGKTLVVVDLHEQQHRVLTDGEGLTAVAFSPDGFLVTAGRQLAYWNIHSTKKVGSLAGDLGDSDLLVFSPDGTLAVSFTEFDRTHLGFWDWSRKKLLYRHRYQKVTGLWFTQASELYVQLPKFLIALDSANNTQRLLYIHPVEDVSADGRRLALLVSVGSNSSQQVRKPFLVDMGVRNSLIKWSTPFQNLHAIKLFPDGRRALAANDCGDLILLDAAGRALAKLSSRFDCYRVRTPDGRLEAGAACEAAPAASSSLLQSLGVAAR